MVRTRIAPSPTGNDLHIGNLYTALINYVVSKRNKGKFIIRIEDTDRERYIKGAEEKILQTIRDYHLRYDEAPDIDGPYGPYRQSDRLAIYSKYAKQLIRTRNAYYCFCTKERIEILRKKASEEKKSFKYDKHCLLFVKNPEGMIAQNIPYVIRLNVKPGREIIFKDAIRGVITFQSDVIDDQILMKSDGYPTYHFAVVIDDYLMKISHVIRAEEWISSTPKHILLYEAFGWELPVFAHVPILRNADKSKLSKRKNPVWAAWFLEQGYLPEAVINFLALMGWSHPEEKEIFSLEEFIELFNLEDMKPVGPIFDNKKLDWMNGVYIRNLQHDDLAKKLLQRNGTFARLDKKIFLRIINLAQSRMETLRDFDDLALHFVKDPDVSVNENGKKIAGDLHDQFEIIKDWNKDVILNAIKNVLSQRQIRMPVIYKIITGRESGLPLPETLELLGKDKTLERLKKTRS